MKRNLFALFGSVAVLLTATVAQAGAQTSGTQPTPSEPMIQQLDPTIQDRALERLQDRAEEDEDFLNVLD